MNQVVFCGSAGMQHHQQLRKMAQDVIRPLMSGLRSFNHVSEMLLCIEPGIILLPESQQFHDIREQIDKMNQQMKESQNIAKTELQRTDQETEHLTAELNSLANQKRQRESELFGLQRDLESHRSNLNYYNESLEVEKRNLESANNTRDRMEEKRSEAETIRNVGAGLLAIPVFGWIAGGIMLGVSANDWNEANDAVNRAAEEVETCESQVNLYSAKVSEYSSKIYQAERDIKMADNKIHETEAKLRALSMKREFVADVQEKIRHAVHQLGLLCGVGSVAEVQTRHMIVLEPVIKVFEEMTTALGRITGDDLLHTEGMHSLMHNMKENQGKLKQLVDSNKSLSSSEYY